MKIWKVLSLMLLLTVGFSMTRKTSDSKIQIYYSSPTASLTIDQGGNVSANTLTGKGSNITSINATNIDTGTLANARLSSAVSLLDQTIGTSELEADAVTKEKVNADVAGDGLAQNADGSLEISAGTGVELNSDSIRIAAAAAGDGLQGGAGSALAVDVSNFAGTGLEDDGSENLRIAAAAAGNGLTGGAGSALAVNVDDSTIETTADTLQVKDAGITNAKIVTMNSSKLAGAVVINASASDSTVSVIANSNVGIGTINPNSVLQVDGAIATTLSTKSSNYTVTATDSVLLGNASGGSITFTLPTAVGMLGRKYTLKKTDSSANTVTVDGNGTETLDGNATYLLTAQWEFVEVVSDNSNWVIVGHN